MPERIQLSRKKGWRLPANAVSVARPTKWGNPYHGDGPFDHARVVALFREYVDRPQQEGLRALVRAELAGKDLACWCPLVDENGDPVPCHANVLLELANR